MAEISTTILEEIRTYENTPDIGVEITKAKGLFSRRKIIHIFGAVRSDDVRDKISQIALKHAGDNFDVSNEVRVRH